MSFISFLSNAHFFFVEFFWLNEFWNHCRTAFHFNGEKGEKKNLSTRRVDRKQANDLTVNLFKIWEMVVYLVSLEL